MQKICITKRTLPDKHWVVYTNNRYETKHVNLSGCANNFSLATGYISNDNLQAVGWRYEEEGQLCYELFNIGHIVLYVSLRPGPLQIIGYLLRGKDPKVAHSEFLGAFEEALNRGGWKTVERKEVTL